jgi:acetone carboxylase gamma subunit
MESGKLLFVRQAMQIKVEEAELKNPKGDYKEAWQKVELLVETEEYLRQIYELAYQLNTAAFRAEQRITILQIKYDKLKAENETLRQSIIL